MSFKREAFMAEPYLGNPGRTSEILRKYNISAKKKYGQNFLIDAGALEGIIESAGVTKDDFVLEVGPGIGTLTQYLAAHARKVCAVEIDRNLLPILEDTLKDWDNVEVVPGDILKTDIGQIAERENGGRPIKVVANLPYYITTPIILGLFESRAPMESMTVMVQKEVADRMQAGPGSKIYGALSLVVQYHSEPRIDFIVHPNSFLPQPGVDSAVVTLKRHRQPPVEVKDEKLLFDLIRASFNQRRKKLSNGIANFAGFSFSRGEAEEALKRAGVSPTIRGEALDLGQFAKIADTLYEIRFEKQQ